MEQNKPDAGEHAGHVSGRTLTGRPGGSVSSQHQRQRSLGDRPPPLKPSNINVKAGAGAGAASSGTGVTKPPPAVYWNDKQSIEQQRQQERTFYNDTTPPPSPSYIGESKNSLSIGYPSAKGAVTTTGSASGSGLGTGPREDGGYDYRWDHVAPPAPIPSREDRLCGLRKKVVWILVGVVLVMILALAIGLGIGLSPQGSSDEESNSDG